MHFTRLTMITKKKNNVKTAAQKLINKTAIKKRFENYFIHIFGRDIPPLALTR